MAVTKPNAGLFLLGVEKKSNGIFSRRESLSIGMDRGFERYAVSAVVVLQEIQWLILCFAERA